MSGEKPAILGGKPAFPTSIGIIRPSTYDTINDKTIEDFTNILKSGRLSNINFFVDKFEKALKELFGVKHVLLTHSCTTTLVLGLQRMGLRNKDILLPTFTFSASAHPLYWNNCKITFVDADSETFNISIDDILEKITRNHAAILATHVFGNPCNIKALMDISNDYGVKLIFDAAHGIGSFYNNKHVAFYGDLSAFSASPTKLITTFEGGIGATNSDDLAKELLLGRNYGQDSNYDCTLPGLNSRMSEVNALFGYEMFKHLDEYISNRQKYVSIYINGLKKIPGISFQKITPTGLSSNKDFAILIDEEEFGLPPNIVREALTKEGIQNKQYFHPLIHQLTYYKDMTNGSFKNAEEISRKIICLPIHNKMEVDTITKIITTINNIQMYANEIKNSF